MTLTIEDVRNGIHTRSPHGRPPLGVPHPQWIGEVLAALSLVAGDEDVLYAHAIWTGSVEDLEARVDFLAITDSCVVASVVPESHGPAGVTRVVGRRSLDRLELTTSDTFAAGGSLGVRVALRFEGWDEEVSIPGPDNRAYVSNYDVSQLIAGLAQNL